MCFFLIFFLYNNDRLYNESPVRETVVVNDRWGHGTSCRHGGFFNCEDRYNPGILMPHKWENALTIDKHSWGHRADITLNDVLSNEDLIREIVTTVSCNGNVLINIGPTLHGTIPLIFEERLREMGDWLRINGEAIYGTRPWVYQNDTVQSNVWYTSKRCPLNVIYMPDIKTCERFVYAIFLTYPTKTNSVILRPWSKEIEGSWAIIHEYRDEKVNLVGLNLKNVIYHRSILAIRMLGLNSEDNAFIAVMAFSCCLCFFFFMCLIYLL